MTNHILNFCNDECGGGVVEYSLILALVAIAGVVALTALGAKLTPSFNNIASKIT